jgi:hypothetical protein
MARIAITLLFGEPGYIAHPMTEERSLVINILKKSGYNRARGEAKRKQVLDAELSNMGITMEQYAARVVRHIVRKGGRKRGRGSMQTAQCGIGMADKGRNSEWIRRPFQSLIRV